MASAISCMSRPRENKSEARKVGIGQKTDQTWEIVQGLNPGDEILLKKPETP